jgi:hypothetical protein
MVHAAVHDEARIGSEIEKHVRRSGDLERRLHRGVPMREINGGSDSILNCNLQTCNENDNTSYEKLRKMRGNTDGRQNGKG